MASVSGIQSEQGYTLSDLQTYFVTTATDDFWKHCDKSVKLLTMSNLSFCDNVWSIFTIYFTVLTVIFQKFDNMAFEIHKNKHLTGIYR